jgi:anti-sigma factor RsiW
MNCKCVSQKIGSYLDGELTGSEMQAMRSHLYECAACAEETESYRSLKSALSSLPCCAPPADLEERLMRNIRLESGPVRRRHAGILWSSAIVAAATAGFVFVWVAGPRSHATTPQNVASKTVEPQFELSRDQAYQQGADSLSGPSMAMTVSYSGSSHGK